ncbi:DUF6250 domain-containing protein [Sinomicrobium sp. M5D2P9]
MSANKSISGLIIPAGTVFLCFLIFSLSGLYGQSDESYQKGELLYHDNFDSGMGNWIVETPKSPNSGISVLQNKLIIDVDKGATVWFREKLSGNILIEYRRKVVIDGNGNDRLSDLNQFWMASDPNNTDMFTRTGIFSEYDSLSLYYFGMGGNYNSTTRFRKYTGNGERKLLMDTNDKDKLLKTNQEYHIKITVYNGTTKVFVNDREFVSYTDPKPLSNGYFGFRTVKSHQEISDFKVCRLK